MALMDWSDSLSVGVKAMDEQHKLLVQSLNDLHAAMMRGAARAATGPLLERLMQYTHDHFGAEEALLSQAAYPNLEDHRKKHAYLSQQVTEFIQRHKRHEVSLNLHLLNFLRDWLTHHILKEDVNYGIWLRANGMNESETDSWPRPETSCEARESNVVTH